MTSWICILKKNLYEAWLERRKGVPIATERRGSSDVLDLHFFKNLVGCMAIATERRGYSDGNAWL